MNVIFLEPGFPENQRQFVRALASIGANVYGVDDRPGDWLGDELKGWLEGYQQIASVTDEGALEWAVCDLQSRVWVDRLEAVVEAHVLPAVHVRERCTIPGLSAKSACLCRDKVAMKEVLRKAGVPTAASAGIASTAEARDFAAEVGFAVIVKPRDGAPAAIEEFVEGHEGFYDTLTVDGCIGHDFISHYYPNVLEAMRTRWISPQIVSTNRMNEPDYAEVKEMGRRVVEALEISTSATHMEWFFGSKGLRFSEIGCRPPGVGQWDSYSAGNDVDFYHEWAMAVCHGRNDQPLSRSHASGIIALRPDRDGRIAGYEGLDKIASKYGDLVVDSHFPDPGTPTQGIEAGYMANAWMRVRHPNYDTLRAILNEIGEKVQVRA